MNQSPDFITLGGSVLLVLGIIYTRQWLRSRAQEHALNDLSDRPMASLGTPLMSTGAGFTSPNLMASPLVALVRPPISPLSTSSSELRSNSSSSSGSHSLHSPNSENFHFPLLSADGHLLPPAPASSRRSWIDASALDAMDRPLPSPPPVATPIFAPAPQTPKRWSYISPRESPSPERSDVGVVGLYSGIEIMGDDSFELLRDEIVEPRRKKPLSPTITRVSQPVGMYQPQKATFYRTLSAEGEDLGYEDGSSGHGHPRY